MESSQGRLEDLLGELLGNRDVQAASPTGHPIGGSLGKEHDEEDEASLRKKTPAAVVVDDTMVAPAATVQRADIVDLHSDGEGDVPDAVGVQAAGLDDAYALDFDAPVLAMGTHNATTGINGRVPEVLAEKEAVVSVDAVEAEEVVPSEDKENSEGMHQVDTDGGTDVGTRPRRLPKTLMVNVVAKPATPSKGPRAVGAKATSVGKVGQTPAKVTPSHGIEGECM